MSKSILILGGSGFVGKAICREAIRRGWQVTSLNRKGAPLEAATDEALKKVDWQQGNALDPNIYDRLLKGKDYLVHSIGILFEGKNASRGRETYRALIRDTTEVALEAAKNANISAIGYVSAARYGALGKSLLGEYMKMKDEAEVLLQEKGLKTVILRPGFIYGSDRWLTLPLSWAVWFSSIFTAGLMPKSLSVEAVAKAMLNELEKCDQIEAAIDNSCILEVDEIAKAASE